MQESPPFLKSFEMLTWLLKHTRKFPKHPRFVMAKRMEEAALGFHCQRPLVRQLIARRSVTHANRGLCVALGSLA